MFSTIIFAIKLIAIGIVVLIVYSIYHAIKEQRAFDAIQIPEFPPVGKDGTKLMRTEEFTLSGVNHVHDGCDPQKILNPMMKGQWLPLNGGNVKSMIFERLVHGLDVLTRFEHTTSIQIGGWDLDENDPKLSDYEFTSAVITCGVYEIPGGRYKK